MQVTLRRAAAQGPGRHGARWPAGDVEQRPAAPRGVLPRGHGVLRKLLRHRLAEALNERVEGLHAAELRVLPLLELMQVAPGVRLLALHALHTRPHCKKYISNEAIFEGTVAPWYRTCSAQLRCATACAHAAADLVCRYSTICVHHAPPMAAAAKQFPLLLK